MFEMTAEWWFSEPSEYVINLGKKGTYESISPFEFLAAFVSAVKNFSLDKPDLSSLAHRF